MSFLNRTLFSIPSKGARDRVFSSFQQWALRRPQSFSLRAKSTAPRTRPHAPEASRAFVFPQRLLVYHAGTGRTVLIGCTKVSTFFLFGFACTVIAPMYYNSEEEPVWMVPTVITGGLIPLLYVALTTKPFVTYIHLRLPSQARVSRESLTHYLNTSGRDLELDVGTMRLSGLARTVRCRMADLRRLPPNRPGRSRFDVSNLVHESAASSRRSAVSSLLGVPRRFHVSGEINHSKEARLWKALLERIPVEEKVARGGRRGGGG